MKRLDVPDPQDPRYQQWVSDQLTEKSQAQRRRSATATVLEVAGIIVAATAWYVFVPVVGLTILAVGLIALGVAVDW